MIFRTVVLDLQREMLGDQRLVRILVLVRIRCAPVAGRLVRRHEPGERRLPEGLEPRLLGLQRGLLAPALLLEGESRSEPSNP